MRSFLYKQKCNSRSVLLGILWEVSCYWLTEVILKSSQDPGNKVLAGRSARFSYPTMMHCPARFSTNIIVLTKRHAANCFQVFTLQLPVFHLVLRQDCSLCCDLWPSKDTATALLPGSAASKDLFIQEIDHSIPDNSLQNQLNFENKHTWMKKHFLNEKSDYCFLLKSENGNYWLSLTVQVLCPHLMFVTDCELKERCSRNKFHSPLISI